MLLIQRLLLLLVLIPIPSITALHKRIVLPASVLMAVLQQRLVARLSIPVSVLKALSWAALTDQARMPATLLMLIP